MASRLFVKIYLTLIVSLVAVAAASGLYWRAALDREDIGFGERRDQFLAAMLPRDADPRDLQRTVDRLSRALGADIAVYAPDGGLLASTGPKPPPRVKEGHGPRGPFSARLEDGRVVSARFVSPWRTPGRSPAVYFLLIAIVVGAAAFPVVRHLTRRLERLRQGVERFGDGDLLVRVPVKGKDEIAAVARSFNRAAERIERLVEGHRTLLANASHELRSPVARLRMAVDLSEQTGGPADTPARAEIVESLGEIDVLVDEILLASRLDHLERLERPEPLDLLALAAEEGARHGVEVGGQPAELTGDLRLLRRLVRNLIVNAQKHGRPPIEIIVSREGRTVRLSVRDHGPGIAAGEATRIFEPFYRPAGHGEGAGGWGLGLSLVRQIAEHHGGAVRVETPADGGARFVVTLPG